MLKNIELEYAKEILLSKTIVKDTERVDILDSLGRVLANDLKATMSVPGFNRSPLDGYAVKAEEVESASKEKPVKLEVIGQAPAGDPFKGYIYRNTAVRIMTGAVIPDGYNTIIKKEDTDDGVQNVEIYQGSKAYENFVKIGEDVKEGEKIVSKGNKINPGIIGMCASLGITQVEVFKKPRIGIVSTGTELKDISENLEEGKIYNSNLYSLMALVIENNCIPVNLGMVDDTVENISQKIKDNIDRCDLIISTGGASVGDYDLIHKVYEHIGAETLFWRLKMKPGTPALAAEFSGKLLIGLSGNPGAALITFETMIIPLIKKMSGFNTFERKKVTGIMMDDFNKTSNQRRFMRVKVEIKDDIIGVYLSGKQNPGVLRSMITCNGLVDIPANSPMLKKGQSVDLILIEGSEIN